MLYALINQMIYVCTSLPHYILVESFKGMIVRKCKMYILNRLCTILDKYSTSMQLTLKLCRSNVWPYYYTHSHEIKFYFQVLDSIFCKFLSDTSKRIWMLVQCFTNVLSPLHVDMHFFKYSNLV